MTCTVGLLRIFRSKPGYCLLIVSKSSFDSLHNVTSPSRSSSLYPRKSDPPSLFPSTPPADRYCISLLLSLSLSPYTHTHTHTQLSFSLSLSLSLSLYLSIYPSIYLSIYLSISMKELAEAGMVGSFRLSLV